MNILHIVGKSLEEGNGITSAVPPLIREQNKIDSINSKLLILTENKKGINENGDIEVNCISDIYNIENYIKRIYIPDIVIFHELYHFKFIKIYNILKKLGIPYIIKPHCSLTYQAQKKGKIKKIIANKLLFEKFIKNSSAISFLNEDEKIKSLKLEYKSIIVNNGIDIEEGNYENKFNKDEINIIYLSRIDLYHKGLDILLDSFNNSKINDYLNLNIKIYGGGNEKDIEILKTKLKDLNNSKINYYGPIYGKEKIDEIRNSDIFILTSRLEGMPMSILECWSHGLPCIITPGTNMTNDIIENKYLGWVSNLDNISIAETIFKAIDEYSLDKQKYKKECKDWVNKKYSWSEIAKDSIKKYKSIIIEAS